MGVLFKRHDLVYVTDAARRKMLFEVLGGEGGWPKDEVHKLVAEGYDGVMVPGIVRRQEGRTDELCIGLSSPYRMDGMRLRVSTRVAPSAVILVRDPYQVAAMAKDGAHRVLPVFDVLERCLELAREHQVICGVFGSAALELATGLPYCHEASDLDLIVHYEDYDATRKFYEALCEVEKEGGVLVDTELELSDGFAVKLKEVFSDSGSVLAKGFNDVRLLPKEEAIRLNHKKSFQ